MYCQGINVSTLSDVIRNKCHLQTEEERVKRERQLEQEERMAKELARINFEKQREEKMRQYIKENRYTRYYLGLPDVLDQQKMPHCCSI